jgi:REP element-mobilizing transposase RayT
VTFLTWHRRRLRGGALCPAVLEDNVCLSAARQIALHPFVLMPEHVHLLLTPARGVTLERVVCSSLRAATRMCWELSLGSTRKFGREVSPIIGFGIVKILKSTREYIHDNPVARRLRNGRRNIATARHIQGSNWTSCPQRLKATIMSSSNRHEWNSCPSLLGVCGWRDSSKRFSPRSMRGGYARD